MNNINLDLQVKDINLSFQCLTLSYKKLVAHNNHMCVLSQMILKLQIRIIVSLAWPDPPLIWKVWPCETRLL